MQNPKTLFPARTCCQRGLRGSRRPVGVRIEAALNVPVSGLGLSAALTLARTAAARR